MDDLFAQYVKPIEKPIVERSPRNQLSHDIDKMLDEFDNSIHRKINKIKLIMHDEIYGYIGAEKQPEFDKENALAKFNKLINKFESDVAEEINKLQTTKSL